MARQLIRQIQGLCVAAGVTLLVGCSGESTTSSSAPPTKNNQVAHFFGIFDKGFDQRLRVETPLDKTDLLYIAFAHPYDEDGDGAYELGYENAREGDLPTPGDFDKDRINRLVSIARAKNPSIKILISQGWNQEGYWKAAQYPSVFADSVVEFMRAHDLDGFDMDYEIGTDPINLSEFQDLITTLDERLEQASIEDDKQYLFTITPDHTSLDVWNGELVNQLFDYVNLQTYWGNRFDYVDDFQSTGVDPAKMMIGLSSESYNQPADEPGAFIEVAKEIGAQGIFAWRMDTDSMDQMGTPHYRITEKMWTMMGRNQ